MEGDPCTSVPHARVACCSYSQRQYSSHADFRLRVGMFAAAQITFHTASSQLAWHVTVAGEHGRGVLNKTVG